MRSALVLGFGQIGTQIANDLAAAGTDVTIMTRSRPTDMVGIASTAPARAAAGAQVERPSNPDAPRRGQVTWVQGDASSAETVSRAAADAGSEAIFACVHTTYDSRAWARTLPTLESAIMDAAAELDIPVVFPESVYAFAGLDSPITAESPFAPVDDKGRIRQQLLDARAAHRAHVASVVAGDLIGRTAALMSSVVRLCITDCIAAGRRAVVPARTDAAHGITVIDDLAAAMIEAANDLAAFSATGLESAGGNSVQAAGTNRRRLEPAATSSASAQTHAADTADGAPDTSHTSTRATSGIATPAGTHRLVIAPSSNPTLAEIAAYTHEAVGSRFKTPVALPHALVRVSGWFDRSMFELAELAPIWRRPCIIDTHSANADWRAGIDAMLP